MKQENMEAAAKIVKQLHFCGHFLHYRMGGRIGRRRILTTLLEHKEILQKDLQDILDVRSGSLSEIIIKIEAEGLVEKVKSEEDGRNLVLKLTPEGIRQARYLKEEYDSQVENLMSCFSEEQVQELHQLLDVMIVHWTER